jgi:hypothetical protein
MCAEIDGLVIKGKELTKRKILPAVMEMKEMSSAQRERKKKKDYFFISGNSQVLRLGMSLSLLSCCTPSAPQTPNLVDDAISLGLCTGIAFLLFASCFR